MDRKPIPAFYCCYLLRSIEHHASLYVGSTPNPPRRLAQHNGKKPGGAVRTSKKNLRPWEMTCIVTGFPSNIAVLQFEWAWHNAHLTKKISKERRMMPGIKPGEKKPKKPSRPRASLSGKLLDLHLLLRVPSFSRWPLQVRFFCEDVHQQWHKSCKTASSKISNKVSVVLDDPPASHLRVEEVDPEVRGPEKTRKLEELNKAKISTLNIGYGGVKSHVEKSRQVTAHGPVSCAVCTQQFECEESTMLVCPHEDCAATSHIACLARRFLDEGGAAAVLPTYGTCPICSAEVQWLDLMKEFSLRIRGAKELERLFKKPRQRKTKVKPSGNALSSDIVVEETDDDLDHPDIKKPIGQEALPAARVYDEPLPDSWHRFEDDEDALSVASAQSDLSSIAETLSPHHSPPAASSLNAVIEESDWDGAEVLD